MARQDPFYIIRGEVTDSVGVHGVTFAASWWSALTLTLKEFSLACLRS